MELSGWKISPAQFESDNSRWKANRDYRSERQRKNDACRIIAGIEHPMSGQIILDGEDITELDVTERARRGVSFAFQQPVRFKGITVRHLIETAAGGSLDDGKLCNILGNVGLCAKDYLDREVNATLSGGEIKRIEIATVLARHTKLSLLTSRRQESISGVLKI